MSRKLIDQLFLLTVPEVQKMFLEAIEGVVDKAVIVEMIAAIETNDVERLYVAIGFNTAVLNPVLDALEKAFEKSAQITVAGWPSRIQTPSGSVSFVFNMRNPTVEQKLKDSSSNFVTSIDIGVKEVLRSTLEQGMLNGKNPRSTALDIVGRIDPKTKKRIGGVLGLTPQQNEWVSSLGRRLDQLDEKYFTMGLRDKRFDELVREAIKNKKPLSSETKEKILTSYKNRALKYRADMIARTESITAINEGERFSYVQAIEEGALNKAAVKKEWDSTGDLRTRLSHVSLEHKYGKGKGVDFDEPFVSMSGARLMQPGDASLGAPAKEIINCRCKVRYVVDWAYDLRDR